MDRRPKSIEMKFWISVLRGIRPSFPGHKDRGTVSGCGSETSAGDEGKRLVFSIHSRLSPVRGAGTHSSTMLRAAISGAALAPIPQDLNRTEQGCLVQV